MVLFLCMLITLIIFSYVVIKCISPYGLKVNHTLLFSAGFWYYLVFPIVVGETIPKVGTELWENLYNGITKSKLIVYLISLIGLYCIFILSDSLPINKRIKGEIVFSKRTLKKWGLLCLLYFLYLSNRHKTDLFKGYTSSPAMTHYVGPMSAVFLVGFSIYIIRSLQSKTGIFHKDFLNFYLIIYLLMATILMGLGGRLYVVTTLVCFVVILSNYYKPIRFVKVFLLLICGLIGVGAIGLWRIGMKFSIINGLQLISLESIFTSFSLIYFLKNYSIPLVNIPIPFLSSFINLIPSAIFPDKGNFIFDLSDMGYTVFRPYGALNAYMSFMCNFGYIGTGLFISLLTIVLRYFREHKNNFSKLIYSCISANLVFTFFRDPFSVSIIKNILEFSFLIPILLLVLCSLETNKGKVISRRYSFEKILQ